MGVGQQMVCEQNRLRRLQMRLAGHHGERVGGGLIRQHRDDVEHAEGDAPHRIAQPHPEQGGDLIVAGPPSPEAATQVGSDPVDQTPLQRAVNVLVGDDRSETAVGDVGAQAVQAGQQAVPLVVGQQPRAVQYPRVGLGRRDVVGREHPVEVRRLAQGGQRGRRAAFEPSAPQRTLVRGHVAFSTRNPHQGCDSVAITTLP